MTDSKQEDRQLVRQILQGGDGMVQLIKKYSSRLKRFIISRDINACDADDILQETWLRVVRYLRSYRFECRFFSWLVAIAKRRIIEMYKKHYFACGRSLWAIEWAKLTHASIERIDDCTLEEWRRRLSDCLNRIHLSQSWQETLERRYHQKQKLAQIAREMNVSLGTVKSRLHAINKKLGAAV